MSSKKTKMSHMQIVQLSLASVQVYNVKTGPSTEIAIELKDRLKVYIEN